MAGPRKLLEAAESCGCNQAADPANQTWRSLFFLTEQKKTAIYLSSSPHYTERKPKTQYLMAMVHHLPLLP